MSYEVFLIRISSLLLLISMMAFPPRSFDKLRKLGGRVIRFNLFVALRQAQHVQKRISAAIPNAKFQNPQTLSIAEGQRNPIGNSNRASKDTHLNLYL